MTLAEFVSKYNGVHIDEDGYYGAQCWDVSARYAREVVGCPSFPTGSGGAEGLFHIFADPIPKYFDRIANDPKDPNQIPQAGDVIVWQASFSPPYGHTAVVVSCDTSGPTVLEQNGNNPGGVSYIKKRNWVGVSGWLRPKVKETIAMPNNQDVVNAFKGYGIDGPTDHQIEFYTSRPWTSLLDDLLSTVANRERATVANLNAQLSTLNNKVTELTTKVDELVKVNNLKDGVITDQNKQIESLKAQVGNNTKWETFKALIRELFTGKSNESQL